MQAIDLLPQDLKEIATEHRLDEWGWEGSLASQAIAMEGAAIAVREIKKGLAVYAPKIWGPESDGVNGPDVDDPLELRAYVMEAEDSLLTFSLRDILMPALEDAKCDGSFSWGLRQISNAMKSLAAEIDAAIGKEAPE